jgi:MFS family permease
LSLNPTILACWAALFGANWALSLALSWQGAYLINGLGLAQDSIGFLGALGAAGSAVVMLATGRYSQHLLSRGVSSRLARGILGGLSVILGGVALAMLPYVPGIPVKIALSTLGVALPSAIYVIGNAVVGEITPAAQRGAVLAIGTAVASLAGLMAPYVMGSFIETATTPLDGFNTGFFTCGVILLAGGAIAMALVNPERETKRRTKWQEALVPSVGF